MPHRPGTPGQGGAAPLSELTWSPQSWLGFTFQSQFCHSPPVPPRDVMKHLCLYPLWDAVRLKQDKPRRALSSTPGRPPLHPCVLSSSLKVFLSPEPPSPQARIPSLGGIMWNWKESSRPPVSGFQWHSGCPRPYASGTILGREVGH